MAPTTAMTKQTRKTRRTRRPKEDTSHSALMACLRDERRTAELSGKVCSVARGRYGILAQDAEDIFHEAVVTYLTIHERYTGRDNHFGLLVGIFHKKCLEHLGHRDRDGRVARRLVTKLKADRPAVARGEDPKGAAVERVIRGEDADLIKEAIGELKPEAQDLLLTLAEGRRTRLELIDEMGINRNTFDTRLRSMRLKLRKALVRAGVIGD